MAKVLVPSLVYLKYIPSDFVLFLLCTKGVRQRPVKKKNINLTCPIKLASIAPADLSVAAVVKVNLAAASTALQSAAADSAPESAANLSSLSAAAAAVVAGGDGAATKAECVRRPAVKGPQWRGQAFNTTEMKTESGLNKTINKHRQKRVVDPVVQAVDRIYRLFKRCSGGGADGGVIGNNGSVRASVLVHILRSALTAWNMYGKSCAGQCHTMLQKLC